MRMIDKKRITIISVSVILIVLIASIIIACFASTTRGEAQSSLDAISENYEILLKDLCEKYGLADAKIEVEGFSYASDTNYYASNAKATSARFLKLTGEKAFSFAKEVEQLDNKVANDEFQILYSVNIYSNDDNKFEYKSERSNSNTFEYLTKNDDEVVIYKNGMLVYNVFEENNK